MVNKKISYVLLALTVVLSVFPFFGVQNAEASDRFSDVANSHWASKEIDYVAEKGIATGDDTGRFRPDESLTRAQASVMMTHALGEDSLDRSQPTFSDVDRGYWAYTRIEKAAEMGIFKGKNGKFFPGDSIEKAQVAAIVARAFFGQESENFTGDVTFSDISNSFWAKGYIATLVDNDIIEDGGRFQPNEPATRAELSAYVARALNESLRINGNGGGSDTPDNGDSSGSVDKPADDEILYEGVVKASTPLNVRKGPGMDHQVIDSLTSGTKVNVYAIEGEWLKISVDDKTGYVYQSYVKKVDEVHSDKDDNTKPASPIAQAKVTASTLLVRSGPGTNHEKVGSLSRGELVDIYERTSGSWVLIKYKGDWAYTHSGYLNENFGSGSLKGKTIVVDAGHGGHDPGASGHGLVEKTVNLNVALRVGKLLRDAGVDVVMTRDDDTFVTLRGRVAIAERAKADSFVSIHSNSFLPSAEGAESFYHSRHRAKESKELATAIQKRLVKATGMKHRRVAEGNFHVIRETSMPSTLIELGFVTNKGDAERMKQPGYYDKAARAIFNGIQDYYEG
ncbi:N-acetylmuramoyl-L-alanine amidase [Bacillus piscicola]|uniref:N-acetylmuramoyl-L-alanine amidase n=1 Tax=Bacillus piscicola TaxID=1632684 RepID=UPI001F08A07A|nr:N-acetylmuramoyl-L-alanine amidase [Bacillus piscicola]